MIEHSFLVLKIRKHLFSDADKVLPKLPTWKIIYCVKKGLEIIFDEHMSRNAHTKKISGSISSIQGTLLPVHFSLRQSSHL